MLAKTRKTSIERKPSRRKKPMSSRTVAETAGTDCAKLKTLPDYLRPDMEVVFVGFNPGERSARLGHYYAGIGNLFWPGLCRSGLLPCDFTFEDDWRMPEFGIGLTDLAKTPSRSITDLPPDQFRNGRAALRRKLRRVKPRVIVFIGKGAYERFTGKACALGAQEQRVCGAAVFVLPSTSARNASVPRAEKLKWFIRMGKFVMGLRATKRSGQAAVVPTANAV
jgi:mismatch-specific thymine-DNA glycosylase